MANGAIALSAAIEPPSEHLAQDAPIESELAIAVGEAAAAIYQALGEHQAGGFGRATKMRGGKKIAGPYELHEGMTDADFAGAVKHHGAGIHAAVLDTIIEIVGQVAATMRAEAN